VEVVFPVEQQDLKHRLIHEILAVSMADNTKARELLPDGTYKRLHPEANQPRVRSQERFLEIAAQSSATRLTEEPAAPVPPAVPRRGRERRPRRLPTG
jgi:polyphosphate kinase